MSGCLGRSGCLFIKCAYMNLSFLVEWNQLQSLPLFLLHLFIRLHTEILINSRIVESCQYTLVNIIIVFPHHVLEEVTQPRWLQSTAPVLPQSIQVGTMQRRVARSSCKHDTIRFGLISCNNIAGTSNRKTTFLLSFTLSLSAAICSDSSSELVSAACSK